jgi:hypothetical protein
MIKYEAGHEEGTHWIVTIKPIEEGKKGIYRIIKIFVFIFDDNFVLFDRTKLASLIWPTFPQIFVNLAIIIMIL